MATKDLKLAIMGASGVGKSVFLASYFKYTTQDGKGELAINLTDSESIEYVSEMIQTLFIEHKPISGTDKRYNMSFQVSTLDCTISLYDIPGGWTTSPASWEEVAVNIYNDLKTADGVIFFVSVGDLLQQENYNVQSYKDMQAFSLALEHLRKPKDKSSPRQDVPVCVVFTKGDLSPETDLDQFESRYRAFLKNAQDGGKTKWFKLGQNVKCWKSIAMGRWEKQDQPPVEGEHQNVIEPMEWLIQRMGSAKSEYRKRWIELFSIVCILFLTAIVVTDHVRWALAKTDIVQRMEAHRYDEAETALNNFENRLVFGRLLPDFIEACQNADDIRNSIHKASQAHDKSRLEDLANKHFDALGPYIKGADWSRYPQAEYAYYAEGVNKLQEYLDRTEYYQVTPAKYDKVKEVLPYWTVCRELRSVETNTENSELVGDDAFARLEKLLKSDMEIPDEWRERLNPKVHGLVLVWLNGLPVPDSPEMATRLVGKGNILSHYSTLPQESALVLDAKIGEWKQAELQLWEPICNQWLGKAVDREPVDAIAFLSEKRAEANLPQQFRQTIDDALGSHWQRCFDRWADEASSYNNPQEAYTFLERQLSVTLLPQDIREKLEEKLRYYEEKIIEAKVDEIRDKAGSARNLGELAENLLLVLNTVGNDCPGAVPAVNNILAARLGDLVQDEFSTLDSKFGNYLVAENFDRARETMKQGVINIKADLDRFRGRNINVTGYDRTLMQIQDDMMRRLEEGEFEALKRAFNRLKNESSPSSYEIDAGIKYLERFLNTYPVSDKNSQVMQVKEFLSAVSNGINGTIIIKSSDCSKYLYGDDEFVVKLSTSNGESWESRQLEGAHIAWNERVPIRWTPTANVSFELIEKDIKYDDEFLSRTVSADGIFGFRRLENCYLRGDKKGCSLSITAEFDPPRLPSGWE